MKIPLRLRRIFAGIAIATTASLLSTVAATPAHAIARDDRTDQVSVASQLSERSKQLRVAKRIETPTYTSLDENYFSRRENQGVTLISSVGTCTTDSHGCWSSEQGAYIPVLVDISKVKVSVETKDIEETKPSSVFAAAKKPGVLTVISDIATLVGVVAAVVFLVAASPAVVSGAGTVAAVAGVVVGSIYLCQKYLGCTK